MDFSAVISSIGTVSTIAGALISERDALKAAAIKSELMEKVLTAQGALMGDVVILGPQTWMVDATEAGLLELRPQQADDLLNPYALEYRAPEQRWVRSSLGPR